MLLQGVAIDLRSLCLAFGCLGAIIILGLFQLLRPVDKRRAPQGKRWKLPSGPSGWPLVGNLFLYRRQDAPYEIAKHGEIVTTHLGSKLWVVLNSNRLISELYGRKGSVTNGRPHYPVVSDLISQGRRSVLLPPQGWSERRRVMHQLLSGSALTRYQGYQNDESNRLLSNYLEHPEEWYKHNHTYSNSVIHRITFGEQPSKDNEKMARVAKAQFEFLKNAPPYNLWDCFPELASLPNCMQWWRARYDAIGRETISAYSAYWMPLKSAIEQGKIAHSFAKDLILGEGKFSGGETDKMFLAMQLVEAGSDTTRLATNIGILAAITHPAKAAKARAEIDSVCGSNGERLPCFQDESRLPYINAYAKEMLRWRRIFDWTPEHMLTEDLEFEGYHFPKGTNFVINHAAIADDPTMYPNPESFQPERWLDGHESEIWDGSWQFGHGRRLCVGYRLAQKSIFLVLARLLYCFDFEAREAFDTNKINHFTADEPFPVSVRVRSANFAELITRTSGDGVDG